MYTGPDHPLPLPLRPDGAGAPPGHQRKGKSQP